MFGKRCCLGDYYPEDWEAIYQCLAVLDTMPGIKYNPIITPAVQNVVFLDRYSFPFTGPDQMFFLSRQNFFPKTI